MQTSDPFAMFIRSNTKYAMLEDKILAARSDSHIKLKCTHYLKCTNARCAHCITARAFEAVNRGDADPDIFTRLVDARRELRASMNKDTMVQYNVVCDEIYQAWKKNLPAIT